jgi:hypothetical protein
LNAKTFAGGDYSKREQYLKQGTEEGNLLLIEFFQFLHPAKGDPINDRVIHAHHQSWCNDKFTIFVIDLVHRFGNRVGALGKLFQLLTSWLSSPKRAWANRLIGDVLAELMGSY